MKGDYIGFVDSNGHQIKVGDTIRRGEGTKESPYQELVQPTPTYTALSLEKFEILTELYKSFTIIKQEEK